MFLALLTWSDSREATAQQEAFENPTSVTAVSFLQRCSPQADVEHGVERRPVWVVIDDTDAQFRPA